MLVTNDLVIHELTQWRIWQSIPQYARSADGKLDTSIFYYKLLTSDVETR